MVVILVSLALTLSETLSETLSAAQAPVPSPDNAAWSQVRQLAAGQDIRVALDDATSQGAFRAADDASITLVAAGQDQRVPRAGIRRILVPRGTHRKRNILLGLAIGGVTGSIVVALHCRGQSPGCNEIGPAYFYPFAGAGAGIGALLPARAWQQIYP